MHAGPGLHGDGITGVVVDEILLPRGFMRVRHFGWLSPAAEERYSRVRGLLRAGEAVLRLPDKQAVCCPACGCAMKFMLALRTRARPPPP